ncbi:hypothetical protein ScalyP_jg5001 [Parmales sp. scaly parma]|nr:hypothetical protein ScalyP_jg5001 [Parmales sp. scaly parma]
MDTSQLKGILCLTFFYGVLIGGLLGSLNSYFLHNSHSNNRSYRWSFTTIFATLCSACWVLGVLLAGVKSPQTYYNNLLLIIPGPIIGIILTNLCIRLMNFFGIKLHPSPTTSKFHHQMYTRSRALPPPQSRKREPGPGKKNRHVRHVSLGSDFNGDFEMNNSSDGSCSPRRGKEGGGAIYNSSTKMKKGRKKERPNIQFVDLFEGGGKRKELEFGLPRSKSLGYLGLPQEGEGDGAV